MPFSHLHIRKLENRAENIQLSSSLFSRVSFLLFFPPPWLNSGERFLTFFPNKAILYKGKTLSMQLKRIKESHCLACPNSKKFLTLADGVFRMKTGFYQNSGTMASSGGF